MELDFFSLDENYLYLENQFSLLYELALKHLKIKANTIVSVSLIDDNQIHELNRDYRNIDRSTDVISFAFLDNDINKEKKLKSKGDVVLGDIYISIEHALKQAELYEHSSLREFSFLFVHGLLHLLGYDHTNEEEEKIMFALQDEILNKGGIIS